MNSNTTSAKCKNISVKLLAFLITQIESVHKKRTEGGLEEASQCQMVFSESGVIAGVVQHD